jgi:uncharacterized cofD-like protein
MIQASMRLLLLGGETSSTGLLLDAAIALGAEPRIESGVNERTRVDGACVVVDLDGPHLDPSDPVEAVRAAASSGLPTIAVASARHEEQVIDLFEAGARDVLSAPLHKRELMLRLSALLSAKPRMACLGGGTGLYTILSGLREAPRVLLSSIVTMSDDGGSSGRLRASFGVLPPGDVRRSLVALSNAPEVMNYVMQYRFESGEGLSGHSLGNLLLTALSEYSGGMQGAVKALGDVLNVQGLVMCVTEHVTTLCAEFLDGRIIRGESAIDLCLERPSGLRIKRVWQEPAARTSVDVLAALLAADLIVIGPGDLYTSVLAGLVVSGVGEGIRRSKAKRLYVCNLMTKPGETQDYDVLDHVEAVVDALGADVLDYVLVSCTDVDPDARASYAAEGQVPVATSTAQRMRSVTRAEVIARDIGHRAQLVRHDSAKLRTEILALARRGRSSGFLR